MDPFQKDKEIIVSALEDAYLKISSVERSDMHFLQNKILLQLKRDIDSLKVQMGVSVDYASAKPKREPITKLFGKTIEQMRPRGPVDVNKPGKQTSNEVELAELRMKVEELWPKFLSTEADHLLDSVSDIEIRGVAKRAGLPVTETNPKQITTEFIQQIKDALQKQVTPEKPDLRTPEEIQLDELKLSVDKLYTDFDSIDNAAILDTYSDIEIRGVAKRAGLPVTETNPKKLDHKFLDQVKAAIKKKAEIEKIGK